MARLWAKTVTFDAVCPGDQLPILVKSETDDTIAGLYNLLSAALDDSASEEAYPETRAPTRDAPTGGIPLPAAALCAYAFELLEKGFPITGLMASGSSLDVEAIAPVRAGDTITLTGEVVDKEVGDVHGPLIHGINHDNQWSHSRVVRCRVVMENQDGEAVANAVARVCF